MTITLFHERRRPARPRRAFTADDDATIRAMCADGATAVEIAEALGRDAETVRHRAGRLGVRPQPLPTWRGYKITELHCARCAVLLAHAPAGRDGLCGWCSGEGRATP